MKLRFLVECELAETAEPGNGSPVTPDEVMEHIQGSLENNQAYRMGINQETVSVMPLSVLISGDDAKAFQTIADPSGIAALRRLAGKGPKSV